MPEKLGVICFANSIGREKSTVSRTAHSGFVLDVLDQAVHLRQPGSGMVDHSDRGSQYLSIRYTERLAEAGIEPSVGSVADSYDDALAESINGLFKAEVTHRGGPWRSFEAVEYATLEWGDWFNNHLLLEPIGNIPRAETEGNFCADLETSDIAAQLRSSASCLCRIRYQGCCGRHPASLRGHRQSPIAGK